jgi:hypothetical protein
MEMWATQGSGNTQTSSKKETEYRGRAASIMQTELVAEYVVKL